MALASCTMSPLLQPRAATMRFDMRPSTTSSLQGISGYESEAFAPWFIDWIGLREILQETIDFPIEYGAFRLKISLKPIHWDSGSTPWHRCTSHWNSKKANPPHPEAEVREDNPATLPLLTHGVRMVIVHLRFLVHHPAFSCKLAGPCGEATIFDTLW